MGRGVATGVRAAGGKELSEASQPATVTGPGADAFNRDHDRRQWL